MIKYFLNSIDNVRVAAVILFLTGFAVLGIQNIWADESEVVAHEEKTLDVLLNNVDVLAQQDEQLKIDSGKAHYNMGNIYYQKGEFEIAAREYYQALMLLPNDPDIHFNLAYVSSEQLKDYTTALKHYRMYLYLKPDAHDMDFVKQKILEADLFLKGAVESPIDKTAE